MPVFFQRREQGALNLETHNYEPDKITEVKRYADVTITGTDTLQLIYGSIKQQSLTVRLLRPYNKPFDNIRIGSKIYAVGFSRGNKAFVISEVKNNA